MLTLGLVAACSFGNNYCSHNYQVEIVQEATCTQQELQDILAQNVKKLMMKQYPESTINTFPRNWKLLRVRRKVL